MPATAWTAASFGSRMGRCRNNDGHGHQSWPTRLLSAGGLDRQRHALLQGRGRHTRRRAMEVEWDRCRDGDGQGHDPRFGRLRSFVPGGGERAVEYYAFDGAEVSLFRSDGTAAGTIELAINVREDIPLGVTETRAAPSTATAVPTSCGRTPAARPRSGR